MGNSTQRNILNTVTINFAVKGTSATQKHAKEIGDSYKAAWDQAKEALQEYQDSHARDDDKTTYDKTTKELKKKVKEAEKDFKAWKELFDKGAVDYQKFMDYISTYENLGPSKLTSMLNAIRKSIKSVGDLYDKEGNAIEENQKRLAALAQAERLFTAQADIRMRGVISLTQALDKMNTSYAEASNYVKAYERNAKDIATSSQNLEEMNRAALQNKLIMHECIGEWKLLSEESEAQDYQQSIRTFKDISVWAQKMGIDIRENAEMMQQFESLMRHFGQGKSWSLISHDESVQNIKDLQTISALMAGSTADRIKTENAINTGQSAIGKKAETQMDKGITDIYGENYEKIGQMSTDFLRQEQARWKKQIESVEYVSDAWVHATDVYRNLTKEINSRDAFQASRTLLGDKGAMDAKWKALFQRDVEIDGTKRAMPVERGKDGNVRYKSEEDEKAYAAAKERLAEADGKKIQIQKMKEEGASIEHDIMKIADDIDKANQILATNGISKEMLDNGAEEWDKAVESLRSEIEQRKAEIIELSLQEKEMASGKPADERGIEKKIDALRKNRAEKEADKYLQDMAIERGDLVEKKAYEQAKNDVKEKLKDDIKQLLDMDFKSINIIGDTYDSLYNKINLYRQAVQEAVKAGEWKDESEEVKNLSDSIEQLEKNIKELKKADRKKKGKTVADYAQGIDGDGSDYEKALQGKALVSKELAAAHADARANMDAIASKHNETPREKDLYRTASLNSNWDIFDESLKFKKSTKMLDEQIEQYRKEIEKIAAHPVFNIEEENLTKEQAALNNKLEEKIKQISAAIRHLKDIKAQGKESIIDYGTSRIQADQTAIQNEISQYTFTPSGNEEKDYISKLSIQRKRIEDEIHQLKNLSDEEVRSLGQSAYDALNDKKALVWEIKNDITLASEDTKDLCASQKMYSDKVEESKKKIESLTAQRKELSNEEKEEIRNLENLQRTYKSESASRQRKEDRSKTIGITPTENPQDIRGLTEEDEARLASLKKRREENIAIANQIKKEKEALREYKEELGDVESKLGSINQAKDRETENRKKLLILEAEIKDKQTNIDAIALAAGKRARTETEKALYTEAREIDDLIDKIKKSRTDDIVGAYLGSDLGKRDKTRIDALSKEEREISEALDRSREIADQERSLALEKEKLKTLEAQGDILNQLNEKEKQLNHELVLSTRDVERKDVNNAAVQYANRIQTNDASSNERNQAIADILSTPNHIDEALYGKARDNNLGNSIKATTARFADVFNGYRYNTDKGFKQEIDKQWGEFKVYINEFYDKGKGLLAIVRDKVSDIHHLIGEAVDTSDEAKVRKEINDIFGKAGKDVESFSESVSNLISDRALTRSEEYTSLEQRLQQITDNTPSLTRPKNNDSLFFEKATSAIIEFDRAQKTSSKEWQDYAQRSTDGANIFAENIEKLRAAIKRYKDASEVKDSDGNIIKPADIEIMKEARAEASKLVRAIEGSKPFLGVKKDDGKFMAAISPFASAVSQASNAQVQKKNGKVIGDKEIERLKDEILKAYDKIFSSLYFKSHPELQEAVKKQLEKDEARIAENMASFRSWAEEEAGDVKVGSSIRNSLVNSLASARDFALEKVRFHDMRTIEEAVSDVKKSMGSVSTTGTERKDVNVGMSDTEKATALIEKYEQQEKNGVSIKDYTTGIDRDNKSIETLEKILKLRKKIADLRDENEDDQEKISSLKQNPLAEKGKAIKEALNISEGKSIKEHIDSLLAAHSELVEKKKQIEQELTSLSQAQNSSQKEEDTAIVNKRDALIKQYEMLDAEFNKNEELINRIVTKLAEEKVENSHLSHNSIEEIKSAMAAMREEMRKTFDDEGKQDKIHKEKWDRLNVQYQQADKYLQSVSLTEKMWQLNNSYEKTISSTADTDALGRLKQQMEQTSLAAKQLDLDTRKIDENIAALGDTISSIKSKNLSDVMDIVFNPVSGNVDRNGYLKLLPEQIKMLETELGRLAREAKIKDNDTLFSKYSMQLRELQNVATEVTASQTLQNIKAAMGNDGKTEGFYVKRIQELIALREQGNLTQKEVDELNATIAAKGKSQLDDTLSGNASVKTVDDMRQRIEMLKQYRDVVDVTSKEGSAERQRAADAIKSLQAEYDKLIDKDTKLNELGKWNMQKESILQLVELAKQGDLSADKMKNLASSLEDVRVKGMQLGAGKQALDEIKTAAADTSKAMKDLGETILGGVTGKNGQVDKSKILGLSESDLKAMNMYLDQQSKATFAKGLESGDMSGFQKIASDIREVRKASEELEAGQTLERLAQQANVPNGTMEYYTRLVNEITKLRDSGTLATESMKHLDEVLDQAKKSQMNARAEIIGKLTDDSVFKWDSNTPSLLRDIDLSGKSIEDIERMKKQLEDMRKSLMPSTDGTLIEQTDTAIISLQKTLDITKQKVNELRKEMDDSQAWDILSKPLEHTEEEVNKAKKVLEDTARRTFSNGGAFGIADIGGSRRTFGEINGQIQLAQDALDKFARQSNIPKMEVQFKNLRNLSDDALKKQASYWKDLANNSAEGSADYNTYMQNFSKATEEMNSRLISRGKETLSYLSIENIGELSVDQLKTYIEELSQAQSVLSPIDYTYNEITKKVEKLTQRQKELSANMDTWKDEALVLGDEGFDIKHFQGSIKDLEKYKKALIEYRRTLKLYEKDEKGDIVESKELQRVDRALRVIAGTSQKLARETNAYGTLAESVFQKIKSVVKDDGEWGSSKLAKSFKEGAFSVEDLRNSVKRLKDELESMPHDGNNFFIEAEQVRRAEELLKDLEDKESDHAGVLQEAFASISSYVGTFLSFQKAVDFVRNSYQENMAFSDALTDVQRTTQMSEEEIYNLSDAIQSLDTRASNEELFKLATTAGQLGIKGAENIRGFVEAADMLTITLSELGEEGITNLTKISNLMGDTDAYGYETALKKIGSSIKDLSSNTAASAGPITEFIGRMGSTAAQAGLTSSQIAAIGATIDANGQSIEKASTGLTKFLIGLEGKSHAIAEALHISPKTLDELLQSGQTLEAMYVILDKIKESGGASAEVLKVFGSRGAQMAPVFNTLAEHLEELKDNVNLSNEAFEEGISIENQYLLKNNNAAGYMQRTTNLIQKQFVNSGFAKFWTSVSKGIFIVVQGLIRFNKCMSIFAPVVRAFAFYLLLSGARVDMLTQRMWRAIIASRSWQKAMLGLRNAFKSGSWINIAIAAVTMLIDLVTTYYNKAKEAATAGNKQAAAIQNKISASAAQADSVFKMLERYKKGSKEYNSIIQQINSNYGKYLNYRISETSTANELAIAQQRINAGLREEIALREVQSAKEAVSEEFDEDVRDKYAALLERVEDIKSLRYFSRITGEDPKAVQDYARETGRDPKRLQEYLKKGGAIHVQRTLNTAGLEDRIMISISKTVQKGANEGWKLPEDIITQMPAAKKNPLYNMLIKELTPILGNEDASLAYINMIYKRAIGGDFYDYYDKYSRRQQAESQISKRTFSETQAASENKHNVDMKEMYQIRKEYEKGLAKMQQNPEKYSEKDYKRLFNLGQMYDDLAEKNFYSSSRKERENFARFQTVIDKNRKQLAEKGGVSTEHWVGQHDPMKMSNHELVAYNKKLFNEYSRYQEEGNWKYFGSLFGKSFSDNEEEAEQQARDWANERRLQIEKEFARRHINKQGTWWANEKDSSQKVKKDTKDTIDILLKELEEYYNRQQTAIESEGLSMGRAQELIDRDVNAKHQEYLNMRVGLINSMVGKETKLNAKQQEAYKMFTNEAIAANKKRYAELRDIVESGTRELTEAELKEYETLGEHANSETGWDSIFDPATFMADVKKIQAFFAGSDASTIRKEYSDFVKSLGDGSRDLTAEELQRYNKVRQDLGMGQNVDKATTDDVRAASKDAEAQAANKDVEVRKVLTETLLKGSQSMLEYQKAWAKQIESLRQIALEGAPIEKATDDFRAAISKLGLLFGDSDEEKMLSLDMDEFKRRMETLKEMSADILVMTETDFEKRIEKTSFYHTLWEKQYGEMEEQFVKRRKMGIKALYQETMKYRDSLDSAVRKKAQNQTKLLVSRVQSGTWYEEMYKKYDGYLKQLKAQGKEESEEYASVAQVRKYMFDRMTRDGISYYSKQQDTLKKLQHEVKIEGIIKDLGVSNGAYQSASEMKVARQQLLMERENLNARISMYGGIVSQLEDTKTKLGGPRMTGESEEDYAERLNKLRTIEYNLNIARISNEELVKEAKEKTLEAENTLIEKEKALMSQRLESISQWREIFDELSKSLVTAGASEAESKNWEIAELRAKKALGLTRDTTKQRMLILKQSGEFEEKWLTQEEQMQEEKRIAAMNERAAAWEKFFQSFGEKLSKTVEDVITHQVQKNLAQQRAQEIADVEADAQQAGLTIQKHQQEAYNKELEKILGDRVKLFQSAQDMMQTAMGADGTLDVSLNAEELDRNTAALAELTNTMEQFVSTYSNDFAPSSEMSKVNNTATAGSPTGTTQEKQQYMSQRFQKELGLSRKQAAGLIGNLMHESNLNPSAKNPNSTAYGIAQWLKPRQQTFKAVMGKDIHGSSLEDQTSFVINELQRPEFGNALSELKQASTVEDAAKTVYYKYEIPFAMVNGQRKQVDHTEYSRMRLADKAYSNTSELNADFSSVGNISSQQPITPEQPEQVASPVATTSLPADSPVEMTNRPTEPIEMNSYESAQTDVSMAEPMATPRVSFSTDDMLDLQSFKEQNNKIVEIQEDGDKRRKKSASACAQAMIQAANMYGTVYQAVTNKNLSGQEKAQQAMLGIVGQVSNAMLSVLLQETTAKSTADEGSAIGAAFAKLGPIGGAAAVAGITAMFGMLLGLASNAISKGQSKISSITGSASAGKLSTGMLTYASGRYDNDSDYRKGGTYTVHGNDGNDYDAVFEGRGMTTGIRKKEHFGIFSEVKPEMVIDGDTTQKLVSKYPHLYNSIIDIANGRSPRIGLDYAYITKMLDKISLTKTIGKLNMAKGMPTFAAGSYPYQYTEGHDNGIEAKVDSLNTQGGLNAELVQQLVQVLSDLRDRGISSTLSMKDFDEKYQRYNRWKKTNGLQ